MESTNNNKYTDYDFSRIEKFQDTDGYYRYRLKYNNCYYIFDDLTFAEYFTKNLIEYPDYEREILDLIIISNDCTITKRKVYIKEFFANSLDFYYENNGLIPAEFDLNHNLNSNYVLCRVWIKTKFDSYYYNDEAQLQIINKNKARLFLNCSEDIESLRIIIVSLDDYE